MSSQVIDRTTPAGTSFVQLIRSHSFRMLIPDESENEVDKIPYHNAVRYKVSLVAREASLSPQLKAKLISKLVLTLSCHGASNY